MNANFTILLFILAFANYANAEHHGDVGELIRELTQGDQRLASTKNNAKADPIRNKDLPQLTEINGKGALDKANKKNTKELDQFKKDVEHMGYSAVHVGMSKRKVLIEKWLASPDRVESLVKVMFIIKINNLINYIKNVCRYLNIWLALTVSQFVLPINSWDQLTRII
jgi:hypothetical protein